MSQFNRVVKVAKTRKWQTLRQLEQAIAKRFGIFDSSPAISARLRDTAKLNRLGLMKERKHERINDKTVYFYRIVSNAS